MTTAETAIRRKRLKALGYATYEDYLRSKRWLRRRQQYARTHPKQCAVCHATERLQLHHVTYAHLGHEHNADLRWLCDLCHSTVHTMAEISLDPTALFSAERAQGWQLPDTEPFTPRNQRSAIRDAQGRLVVQHDWRDECRKLPNARPSKADNS